MVALRGSSDQPDASPELYLLFAGRHRDPTQGVGSLVAAYACREEARAAFRHARLTLSDREGWAELSVVSAGGRAKRVSWFGPARPRTDKSLTAILALTDARVDANEPRRRLLVLGHRWK